MKYPSRKGVVVGDPRTPNEFLALNPGERLIFGLKLDTAVTPEVVALLVYTYLNTEMAPQTRDIYSKHLLSLIEKVDPIALMILAYRFVNTSTATPAMLPAHQEMMTVLSGLRQGQSYGYLRSDRGVMFTGTLGRPTYPKNIDELVEAGAKVNDVVLYDRDRVRRDRTTMRYNVDMVLIPMTVKLPATLGELPAPVGQ